MPRPKKNQGWIEDDNLFFDPSTDEVLSKLPGDEKTIRLFRVHDIGKPKFITTLMPGEFDLDTVQERWGGGRFRIEFIDPDTKEKIVRQLEIEGSPKIQTNLSVHREDGTFRRKEEYNPPINDSLVGILERIEKRLETTQNESIQQTLIKALVERSPQASGGGLKEMIEMISALRGVLVPQGNVDANIIKEAISTGVELGSFGANGPAEKGSPWLSLAEKALPMILGVLQRMPITVNPIPESPPVVSPPVNYPASPIENKAKDNGVFASIVPSIQPFLPTMLQAAASSSDPANIADIVLDSLPEDKLQVMKTWLGGDTWLSDLIKLHPGIEFQVGWWSQLREMILQSLDEDPGGNGRRPSDIDANAD